MFSVKYILFNFYIIKLYTCKAIITKKDFFKSIFNQFYVIKGYKITFGVDPPSPIVASVFYNLFFWY